MIRVTSPMRATITSRSSACLTLNNQSRASRAELSAYSKNLARSAGDVREYPSAIFALIDATALTN